MPTRYTPHKGWGKQALLACLIGLCVLAVLNVLPQHSITKLFTATLDGLSLYKG